MTLFALPIVYAPPDATVVATLYAPDGTTVIATLTLPATSLHAETYAGSVALSPTPPDSTDLPYLFAVIATTTYGATTIWPAGSVFGWLYGGNWYDSSDQAAPGATAYLTTGAADTIAATLPPTLLANYLAANTAAKTSALQQATMDVDNATRWQGRKFCLSQPFEFPRLAYGEFLSFRGDFGWWNGLCDLGGEWAQNIWDWDGTNHVAIVPAKVYQAVVYQADFILAGPNPTLDAIHSGLKSQANAGLSESYDRTAPGVATNLCLRAWTLLRNYQLASGRYV